jgi:hypothetical protein
MFTDRLRRLLLLGLIAALASAQIDTGTIVGTITDATGSVVPDVAITIRNDSTGAQATPKSNELGQFVSPPLPPGRYTITAEHAGFRRTVSSITLDVGLRAVVNLVLQLGTSAESVEVVAEAPLLQSETSSISSLRTNQQITDLPNDGRFFAAFLTLNAGVAPVYGAGIRGQGIVQYVFNGIGFRANKWKIDGLDNTENHNGQAIIGNAPIESIQEMQVETSVAAAEFGGGGATINVVMKSGTKDLRGTLVEYLRNSDLDAKNFFDQKKSPLERNQFDVSVGGPVRIFGYNRNRDKTFFFFNYEGIRQRVATNTFSTIPLAAFKSGDFSASATKIYDPTTTRTTPQRPCARPLPEQHHTRHPRRSCWPEHS